MFHILAVITFTAFAIFTISALVLRWRGIIKTRMIDWTERNKEALPQLIHTYFAMAALVLVFITLVFAPVGKAIWLIFLANFFLLHLKFRWPISERTRQILETVSLFAEFAYLFFLAYLIR